VAQWFTPIIPEYTCPADDLYRWRRIPVPEYIDLGSEEIAGAIKSRKIALIK